MTTIDRDAESPVRQVREACRQLVRELGLLRSRHPAVPCTLTEGHLLLELEIRETARLAELAAALCLDKSTLSRALTGLRGRGLVAEVKDPSDRRVKWFRLTARGRRTAGRLNDHADTLVGAALARLDAETRSELPATLGLYARTLCEVREAREFAVRPLEPRDDPAILAVVREVRASMGPAEADYPLVEPGDRQLSVTYRRQGARFYVATRRDRVVGGAGIFPLAGAPGTCELQRMYLLQEARGRGIGARLLETCLQAARELGYERCYLETVKELEAAKRLYRRFGFRLLDGPMGDSGHGFPDEWFLLELGTGEKAAAAARPRRRRS